MNCKLNIVAGRIYCKTVNATAMQVSSAYSKVKVQMVDVIAEQ